MTCIIPALTTKKASADTLSTSRTNTQIQDCDTLYFFSDQSQHIAFCQSLQSDGLINDYVFYNWENETLRQLEDYYDSSAYTTLQNDYVVFELADAIVSQIDNPNNDYDLLTDLLLEMFSTMKENGCQIMFICGKDEAMFLNHNEFLDYVDIHINTDILDIFIMNVFYRMVQANDGEMKLENCTFFLDANFSQNIQQGYKNSWFFYAYFIPYFRSVYRTEITQNDWSSQELFNGKNIKILCHLGNDIFTGHLEENAFYDPVNNTYVASTFTELEPYIENQQICAIGRTMGDQAYSHAWLQLMIGLRDSLEFDLPIYMYEDVTYYFTEYEEPDVYTVRHDTGYYSILEDFVTDQDLTGYDNWEGRCDITHKGISFGPDGWLVSLAGEEDFFVLGWQLYMNEDDYEYFFGYSDDW